MKLKFYNMLADCKA